MLKTFVTSFKLKNTYRVNSIIYSIKGLPIINKILPSSLYKNKFLKIFGNIISFLWEVVSTFLWKGLYVWLVLGSMTFAYKTNQVYTFLHLFVFSTLIGGILNTYGWINSIYYYFWINVKSAFVNMYINAIICRFNKNYCNRSIFYS